MRTKELGGYRKDNRPKIREQLLSGTYQPQPVRRAEIAKAEGGTRKLGIPTVLDRFVQQAVMQVLQGKWDRTFCEQSYGFRPKRSAHQAVAKAQEYVAEGNRWVVDIDLETKSQESTETSYLRSPCGTVKSCRNRSGRRPRRRSMRTRQPANHAA